MGILPVPVGVKNMPVGTNPVLGTAAVPIAVTVGCGRVQLVGRDKAEVTRPLYDWVGPEK